MTSLRYTLPLLVFVLLLAGCDSGGASQPEPDPSINGSWAGTINVNGIALSFDMTLNENDGQISGAGTLTGERSVAIDVTGTYVYPDVSMNMAYPGLEGAPSGNLTGMMNESGDRINARFGGSSDALEITLNRK